MPGFDLDYMNFFRRRRILRNISTPDLVPVRIRGHEIEERKVVILLPKFESKIYHAFSPRLEKLFFRIKLDELGSDAWEAIDGERNVADISKFIRESSTYGSDNLEELDDRLSKYMTMLYERRFISFRQIMEGSEEVKK